MKPWVKIGSERRSHAEVRARARQAAAGFEMLGIGQGDVVAICLRNDFAFLEASLGAQHLGAYVTMLNWHATAAEAAYVLADSGAKILVVHDDILQAIEASVPEGIELFSVRASAELRREYGLPPADRPIAGHAHDWEGWVAAFTPIDIAPRASGGTMIYTSGTTGKPKAVRREPPRPEEARSTFEGYMKAYGARSHRERPGEIVALAAGPLYHAAPSAWTSFYLKLGANIVLEPKFDAARTLQLIEEEHVTHMLAVPTMFVRLLALPAETRAAADLSSLGFVMHGAAPCPPHVKRAMIDWWGPIVAEHYGGTESGVLTFCSSEDWLAHPGTVGHAMPEVDLRILRPDGSECAPGETGEIFGRRRLFPDFTYFGDAAKRQSAERHGLISLGDRGYLDEDGYLFLTGRASDMIISGGVNIYPAEIESEILSLQGVKDCAVFGIPDEEFGERICAVVEPEPGATLDAATLSAVLRTRLASYKIPRRFEFRFDLPREDSGKIMKRKLRDPFWVDAGRSI
ncbi:AMP-binding protein [Sphingopyxis sp.]|jgi:long-chain acyl-CoA synthetase|uniref:AMP-binding protein n=1 Tax=Sphingopyxis sp. TaxID=1908224 RepID=UPI002DE24337|nr:AMP-binding protein [Sphingopyxis sp.]